MPLLPGTHPRGLGVTGVIPPFLLGFSATSFQVFLLREFSAHFAGNEMTYGLVLGSWLLWGGLGSFAAARFDDRPKSLTRLSYLVLWLFPAGLAGLRLSRFALGRLPAEVAGLGSAGLAAFILAWLASFPLGILFVFNVRHCRGDIASVYFLESLGAAAGGLVVQFFLIPVFSNWEGVSITAALAAFLAYLGLDKKSQRHLFPLTLAGLAFFALMDGPSQRLFWSPFKLLAARDSRYGKLQVLQAQEQIAFYSNGAPVFSYPPTSADEEAVHFGLLQRRPPLRVLLIGGGSGGLNEILKYPGTSVDWVEIDPDFFRLTSEFLPAEGRRILSDRRVRLFLEDGRAFLSASRETYDAILLNLPGPATAQINRFYTREFFSLARSRLSAGGILSLRLASAENYISPELGRLLGTLFHTMKSVFPSVKAVPGEVNVFLASSGPLSINAGDLGRAIRELGLSTTYVSPNMLLARLNPLRVDGLRERLESAVKNLNLDFRPVAIYEQALLWSTQFRSFERPLLGLFSRLPRFWMLDFPLGLACFGLIYLRLRKRRPWFVMVPVSIMGLTTMAAEISVLLWFQTIYGSVYGRLAALMAVFMAGLAAGSYPGFGKRKAGIPDLGLMLGGFTALLLLSRGLLGLHPPPLFFFGLLFLFGFLGGSLFVLSNRLYFRSGGNYGFGYGLDLLGSFLGAAAVSTFIIPLLGMSLLFKYLALLNSFCLLFLISLGLRSDRTAGS